MRKEVAIRVRHTLPATWDFSDEIIPVLKQYKALRLMGRFSGRQPERITELGHVEYLYLSRYPDFRFDWLSQFSQLKILEIDYASFKTVSGLAKLPALESFAMTECKMLEDISDISKCASLRAVSFALNNKLKDLSALKSCSSLIYFRCEGREIESIDFARDLTSLKYVILNVNVVDRNLSPLAGSKLVRFLAKRSNFEKMDIEALKRNNPQCEIKLV